MLFGILVGIVVLVLVVTLVVQTVRLARSEHEVAALHSSVGHIRSAVARAVGVETWEAQLEEIGYLAATIKDFDRRARRSSLVRWYHSILLSLNRETGSIRRSPKFARPMTRQGAQNRIDSLVFDMETVAVNVTLRQIEAAIAQNERRKLLEAACA